MGEGVGDGSLEGDGVGEGELWLEAELDTAPSMKGLVVLAAAPSRPSGVGALPRARAPTERGRGWVCFSDRPAPRELWSIEPARDPPRRPEATALRSLRVGERL